MNSIREGYDFDDILLLPRASSVNSRDDVDLSVDLGKGLKLRIPIIVSPMKGIVSPELIKAISCLGGIGILHRFHKTYDEFKQDVAKIAIKGLRFGLSTGLDGYNHADLLFDYSPDIICIDVANGYLDSVLRKCEEVANFISHHQLNTLLMVGNVVTQEGMKNFDKAGADLVRVGIGGGGLCSTRNVTGIGCPQLTAIDNCKVNHRQLRNGLIPSHNCKVISDGGIRNSGDIVKALAFGADAVMIGSLFGHAKEASNNGIIYGMASRKLQEEYYHGSIKSVEGIEKSIEKNTTVLDIINELEWGIRSACTYLNCSSIKDIQSYVNCVEVGNNSIKELVK